MPAPSVPTYSVEAKYDANSALLNLLDAASNAGVIRLRDENDVLLAELALSSPAGSVSAETGALTLTVAGPDNDVDAGGVCAYVEICDGDDNVHLALPAKEGSEAESGYLVLNNTTLLQGGTVSITSAVIG